MTRAALLALALAALAGQACTPSRPAETAGNCEAAVTALRIVYDRGAERVIQSGACDQYDDVTRCPAYMVRRLRSCSLRRAYVHRNDNG